MYSTLQQKKLQLGFLHGLERAGTRAGYPTLYLLQCHRVPSRRLSNLNVEDSGFTDLLDPGVGPQGSDGQDCRFVEALGLDLHAVPDPAQINEADRTFPRRHRPAA